MAISYKDFRAHSFETTGGAGTGTKRADVRKDLWEITVEPDSSADVIVVLHRGREGAVQPAGVDRFKSWAVTTLPTGWGGATAGRQYNPTTLPACHKCSRSARYQGRQEGSVKKSNGW